MDPMIATGGSIIEAVRVIIEQGGEESNITVVCIISIM